MTDSKKREDIQVPFETVLNTFDAIAKVQIMASEGWLTEESFGEVYDDLSTKEANLLNVYYDLRNRLITEQGFNKTEELADRVREDEAININPKKP